MNYPQLPPFDEHLINSLLHELDQRSYLKCRFAAKLADIPDKVLGKYGPTAMEEMAKASSESNYIRCAVLLGFPKAITTPYKLPGERTPKSIFTMAKEYIAFLYDFDTTFQNMVDVTCNLNNNTKSKRKVDRKNYYAYLEHISR